MSYLSPRIHAYVLTKYNVYDAIECIHAFMEIRVTRLGKILTFGLFFKGPDKVQGENSGRKSGNLFGYFFKANPLYFHLNKLGLL